VGSNPFTINATLQANSCASPLNAGTTIIVNPIPNITLTLNGSTVCQNQNGTVTVVNSEAGVNYEPFIGGVSVGAAVAGTGGSITLTIPAANLVLGSNTITVNANSTISGCSAAASATATVVVNPLPSVTINANGSTVCDGQSALVTITNSDPNASYTLVNASSVVVAGPVNGTGAQINLTVPAANLAVGTNNFTVTATITATGCSANGTTPAVITVNPIPSTSVTLAGSTVCQGQDGTVTITNSQNGVVYQMFQGGNPVSPTVNGNGANITLTIPAAQLTVGTNTFNVQATIGATGCSSTANSTVNVVVNPFPPLTLTLSNNSPVCDLQNATVTVQASTPGVSYQLTQNGNPIGVPVNGTGANIDLTVPDANLLVGTNTFTVTATVTATGCTSNLTQTTTITVLPVPSVSLTVNGNTVCDGQSGIITIQNSEPTATYSAVDINNNVIGGPVTGTGANISIPVPAGSLVVGGNTFTVTATSTINNCVGPLTQQATITVNPLPQINLNLPPQTACQGSDGQVLVQASQTNTLYELFQGPTPIGAPVPGTGGDIGLPVPAVNLVVGINTFTVRATNITSGCQSNLTATATIDVIALPTVSFTVTGNTVCDLQNGELTISSTLLNVNYQVSQNGNPIGNPVAGTGGALTLVVPDADLNVGANVFTVTVTLPNSGCFVTSTASGTITVNPLPIDLVATAVPVCVNQSAQVVINNSQPGVAYTVLDATNTVIAGPVNGNGTSALLSVPAANLVAGVNTFNVRAENTLTTCAILFATPLSITVNPLPSSALVVTDVTVCEGSPAVFQVQNPQAGVDYTLINAGGAAVASTSAVNGTNLDITVQPAQLNVGANVFTVVATFTATGCSANLLDQPTITVTPLPVLSVALTGSTVCEGVDGTITVQASQVGVDYQAIIGGNPVGGSVAGTGADITLTVPAASLVVGANTVSVNATLTATGCAANATSTATITVIQAPVFNPQTVVNDFTACEGVDIPYPIELTEVGRSYEIYLGTTLVGGPYAGTGGNIIATIPSGNLLVGANAITVRIINPATQCASTQTASINRTITVVANPSVTIAILEPQPIAVCQNVDGQFTLVNAAANTTYQLFAGTTPIGAPVAGTGGNLVIPVDAADLPQVGLNTFSIVAVSTAPGGCSSTLNTTVTFDVLPEPNITPIVTAPASGNVCFGTGATIGVNPSQLGIDYTPFINGVAVGQAVTGNGGLILLNVDQPFLNAVGTYTVEIRAVNTVTQCGSVLSATTTLNVVAVPAGIVASGRPTCAGNDGVIIIGDLADNTVNSVLGWRYFVYSQSQPGAPVAQEDGTNGDLELTIPGAFLLNPTEAFDIYAVDIATGCTSAVALTVTIQVNLRPSNLITVDGSRICFGGDGEIYLGNVDPLNPSLFSAANTSYQLLDSLNNPIGLPQVGTGTSGLLTFTVPGAPNPRYLLGINRYRFVATDLTTLCTDTLLGIGLLEVFSTPEFEPIAQSVVCQYADEFEVVINQPVGNLTYSLFDIPTGVTLGTPVVSQLGQQSLTLTALVTDISATRTPGVYTVGVRAVSAPNTLTNCQNETSASVRILAAPVVPVDSVAATDVCLGNTGTIRLFATLFPGHLYRIYNADGSQVLFDTLGTSGNVTITMPASVYTVPSTTFNVVVLNTVTGCESAPVPVTVDVFNLPNTIFEPQVVTNPVCEGGPITIRLVNGSGVGTSYQVFNNTTNRPVGDPVLGTGDPIEFTIPFTQSGDVVPGVNELKVIASNPASNCSADLATTVTLNVNPLPDTTLVLTPNVVCQGTGRNGEIIVVNSTTGVSYVVVNATGTPVSDAVPGGGDITLIVPFVNLAPGDNVFSVRATITATGCVATFPATVNIRMTTEAASPTLATTAPICEGSTATIIVTNPSAFQYLLFATENGGTPIAVSDNSGILISTPLLTDTTLWVEARNESCTGSARTPIVIDVVPLPQADFILKTDTNFYKLVVPNAVVEFRNLSRDADSVRWFFGDDSVSTEREPKHTYADSGRYTVTLVVFNELGCTDTLRVGPFIVQAGIRALSLPNAFSPNNDFNNDQFVTIPVGYDSYCIYIYDRWGREVFNNNCEFLKYWDGRDKDQNACPEGVYVYRLTGTVKGQVVKEVSGTVTLVR
jgi:gliding motility-associated-like protein